MLCGGTDGRSHRIYHCPAAKEFRDQHGLQHLEQVPKPCLVWGLFKRPEVADKLVRALDEIQITALPMIQEGDRPTCLFTDGSCSPPGPGRSAERHASYAVRMAVENTHESHLVAAGVLPGHRQYPFRVELFAFMIAMSVSLQFVVFTDCSSVWSSRTRLQREGWSELAWLSSADMDFWRAAWQILIQPERKLQAIWIHTHRCISEAKGAADAWRMYQNAETDTSASVLKNPIPVHIQERLVLQNQELESKRQQIMRYLKAVWNMRASKEASPPESAQASTPWMI